MVEFKNRAEIEAWLKTRPREEIILFAARAALRLLPWVARDERPEMPSALMLPCSRAMAAPWLAGTWPSQGAEVREAAADAAASADAAYAASAADAYAASASAAAYADAAAAAYAASAAASADAYASAAAAASASASADATFLEDGGGVKALSDRPLWPDGEMPEGLAEDSQALKSRLLAEGEDWEVWTDWYEDRLRGTQANLELERARVLIPNEDWEKGPAHVNGIIKRLIEEHGGGFRERAAQRIAAQPERTVADVRQQIVDLDALIAEKEKYRPNSDEAKEANKRELERLLSIRLTLTTVKEGAEALPVPATVEQAEPIADELVRLPAPVKETAEETAPDRRTQLWAAFVATIASFMVRFGMPMDFADLILRPVPGSEEVIERIKKMQEKD